MAIAAAYMARFSRANQGGGIGRERWVPKDPVYDFCFANEFVRGERIASKSEGFRKVTESLLTMLAAEFVSWRGPLCFDNPEVNVREFGDRFRKKAKVKGKR